MRDAVVAARQRAIVARPGDAVLTSAVEERLGGGHRVEVGGTQLERDDDGRTALRLRDIVVRARDAP